MNKAKLIAKIQRGLYPNLETIEVPELTDTDMKLIYDVINNNALDIDNQIELLTKERRGIKFYYHKLYMKIKG